MRNYSGGRRFLVPVFILLALFVFSFAVYWLWNNVLIAVVAVKPVTYWQAMGLLALCRILLGGFRPRWVDRPTEEDHPGATNGGR